MSTPSIAARAGMMPGETFWPAERVYFLVTRAGKLAVKRGQPLTFCSYEDAHASMGRGQRIAGASVLRLSVLAACDA